MTTEGDREPAGEDARPDSAPDDVETVHGDITPRRGVAAKSSDDWLLRTCARLEHEGESRPALGKNVLLRRVGAGGMGFVYEGVQTHLGRRVAIKIVDQGLLERHPETADRFLREARLAAQLTSPHLVQVFDVDRDESSGLHYLVMEFVDGQTAAQWREGRDSATEAEALAVVTGATRGLVHVHAAGIVHRDVKPENLLLPQDAEGSTRLDAAKLADLGLARPDDGTGITRTSSGFGTPGFMSPEQASDARTVGAPADVFSMGATLYALLSGRTPFKGTTPMEVMLATMNGEREAVDTLAGSVSPATLDVLERCLAMDPEERYPDATALLAALEAAAGGALSGPAAATTAPAVAATKGTAPAAGEEPAVTPSRGRSRVVLRALVLVVVVAVLGAGWFVGHSVQQRNLADDFMTTTEELLEGLSPLHALAVLGERREDAERLGLSSRFLGSPRVPSRLRRLESDLHRNVVLPGVLSALESRLEGVEVREVDGGERLVRAWADVEVAVRVLRAVDTGETFRDDTILDRVAVPGVRGRFFTTAEVEAFANLRSDIVKQGILRARDQAAVGDDAYPGIVLCALWRLGVAPDGFAKADSSALYTRMEALRPRYLERVEEWALHARKSLDASSEHMERIGDAWRSRVEEFWVECRKQRGDLADGLTAADLIERVRFLRELLGAGDDEPPLRHAPWPQLEAASERLRTTLHERELDTLPELSALSDRGAAPSVEPRAADAWIETAKSLAGELNGLAERWSTGSVPTVHLPWEDGTLLHADTTLRGRRSTVDTEWRARVVPLLAKLSGSRDEESYLRDTARDGLVIEVLAEALFREVVLTEYYRSREPGSHEALARARIDAFRQSVSFPTGSTPLHEQLESLMNELGRTFLMIEQPAFPAPSSDLRNYARRAVRDHLEDAWRYIERAVRNRCHEIRPIGAEPSQVLRRWAEPDFVHAHVQRDVQREFGDEWTASFVMGSPEADLKSLFWEIVLEHADPYLELGREMTELREVAIPALLHHEGARFSEARPADLALLARDFEGPVNGQKPWVMATHFGAVPLDRKAIEELEESAREVEETILRRVADALTTEWAFIRDDFRARAAAGSPFDPNDPEFQRLRWKLAALFRVGLRSELRSTDNLRVRATSEFAEFVAGADRREGLEGAVEFRVTPRTLPSLAAAAQDLPGMRLSIRRADGSQLNGPVWMPGETPLPFSFRWKPGEFEWLQLRRVGEDGEAYAIFRAWTGRNCLFEALREAGVAWTGDETLRWSGWGDESGTEAAFDVRYTRFAEMKAAAERARTRSVAPETCIELTKE